MRRLLAGLMISMLWILTSCDSDTETRKSERHEAKTALLRLVVAQERFYLKNGTFSNDMTQLGLAADPFVTESGLYTVEIVAGADSTDFSATATRNGADAAAHGCVTFRIDGRGSRTSTPKSDCWTR
jgi:type IV pilus assembly protein PilE